MAASVAGRLIVRSVAKVVREHARVGVALPHLPTSLLSAVLPPHTLSALRTNPRRRQPLLDLRAAFRGAHVYRVGVGEAGQCSECSKGAPTSGTLCTSGGVVASGS